MELLTATLPIVTLTHPDTGQQVTFMAMSHIGPADFYRACNEIIDRHEGIILYEGLQHLTSQEVVKLSMTHLKMRSNLKGYLETYETYAQLLGWFEQDDFIKLKPEQRINCDISQFQLFTKWVEDGVEESAVRANEAELNLLRHTHWGGLVSRAVRGATWLTFKLSRYSSSTFNSSLRQIIVHQRDWLVIDAVGQIPAERHALIIYGAAHATGIVGGLKQYGFIETERRNIPFCQTTPIEVVLGILYLPLEPLLRHAPHWWRRLSRTDQAEPVIELDLTEIDRV